MKTRVVLHRNFGGFHLTTEMVDRMDSLGFPWQDFGLKDKPVPQYSDWCYLDKLDEFAFRSHPILIQTVEELQNEYKEVYTTWYEQRKQYIFALEIRDISLSLSIYDYRDGFETVCVEGHDILGYS